MKRCSLEGLETVAEFGKKLYLIDEDVEDLRLAFNLNLTLTFSDKMAGVYYSQKNLNAKLRKLSLYGLYDHYFVAVLGMLDVGAVETLFLPNGDDRRKNVSSPKFYESLRAFENLKVLVVGNQKQRFDFSWDGYEFDLRNIDLRCSKIGYSSISDYFYVIFDTLPSLETIVHCSFERSMGLSYGRTGGKGDLSLVGDVGGLSLIEGAGDLNLVE